MILDELKNELTLAIEAGQKRNLYLSVSDGAFINQRNRKLLNFTSWDYLDLKNNPQVVKAIINELEFSGIAEFSSRFSSANSEKLLNLEEKIASFFMQPAALVFTSINQVLWTLFTSLLNERDLIIFDESNDTPLHDIAYLTGAKIQHCSFKTLSSLEKILVDASSYRRRFVYAESISSLTGEILGLKDLLALCTRTQTELVVDESNAIAALGIRGAGIFDKKEEVANYLPILKPLAIVSELGRVLGGSIASISSAKELKDLLLFRSTTLAKESPPPQHTLAGLTTALSLIELMHQSRVSLALKVDLFNKELSKLKLTSDRECGPIISIRFNRPKVAGDFANALFEKGILVDLIHNSSPRNQESYVRFIIRSVHSEEHIKSTLAAISDITQRNPIFTN